MKPINYIIALLLVVICVSGCFKDEHTCDEPYEKVALKDVSIFMPYKGMETLKFLHNNTDTQLFVGQGIETYYKTGGEQTDAACPKDYQALRIKFLNTSTNAIISVSYERDENLFDLNISGNDYTFYKIGIGNKLLFKKQYYSGSHQVAINKKLYYDVLFIGEDTTTSYSVVALGFGLVKIKQASELWELIQ